MGADGTTVRITFALVVATAIVVALLVTGLMVAHSRRSDLWFEIAKAGIQLWVIAIVGGGVAAAFKHLESRRDDRRRRHEYRLGVLRREQELKTGLVSEISECGMTFAMELVRFHKEERKPGETHPQPAPKDLEALLRWPEPGRGGPIISDAYQITRARSEKASASRAAGGTSVPRCPG